MVVKRKVAKKKNMGNSISIKKLFLDSVKFLIESKKYILFSILAFFLFAIIGAIISPSAEILDWIKKTIEAILLQTEGMGALDLIQFIFFNNVKVAIISILSGVFFGVIPFVLTMVNGYLLGFVSSRSVAFSGIFSLWKLFPHGVFELPAIFISFGLGIRLGMFLFIERENKTFLNILKGCLNVFFMIIVPLLFVAAIIEGILIAVA